MAKDCFSPTYEKDLQPVQPRGEDFKARETNP